MNCKRNSARIQTEELFNLAPQNKNQPRNLLPGVMCKYFANLVLLFKKYCKVKESIFVLNRVKYRTKFKTE
jgi:hypothetical protein